MVNLLALDDGSHLHFLFGVEGKCLFYVFLRLFAADHVAFAEEVEHLLPLLFQCETRSRYILHQQRSNEIECSREEKFVALGEVADHEEDVDNTAGEFLVAVVVLNHAYASVNNLMTGVLETFREHVVIQFIECDVTAHFIVGAFLCRGVNHLDDASLSTLYLSGYIAK